jgi:hypothetical protein
LVNTRQEITYKHLISSNSRKLGVFFISKNKGGINLYEFGIGSMFAVQNDGTSIEFGTLQNSTFGFSFDKKELYGRKQMPVHVARGKGKAEGKAEWADIKASSVNLILNGTETTGQRIVAEPINAVVPDSSPYTVTIGTIPNSGTFNALRVVYDVSGDTKKPMTLVTGTPLTGQYAFATVAAVAGARTYTVTTNFVADDTIAVGGVTLTAKTSGATGLQFNIGATIADSVTNIQTILDANSTVNAIYTVTKLSDTFTLTETVAGVGNTPSTAIVVGTGVVSSGTATTSTASTKTLTFAVADINKKVQYQYDYNVTTGKTITLTNNMMGTAPTFEVELYTVLDGHNITLVLNKCTTDKLDLNFKNEDYLIPSFSFSAMSDSSDVIGMLYLDE